MKFNQGRVKKIAIDINQKQQLYLSSSKYNHKILNLLKIMGYRIDYKDLLNHPKKFIFIINTKDKRIFRTRGSVLACALPNGAKLLDSIELMTLIDFK